MKNISLFLAILLFSFPASADSAVKKWSILHDKSGLTFKGTQMGTEFKGGFGIFTADIAFDPDNLPASTVTVTVDINSVSTDAADRDETLKSKDWFDVVQFPSARFETTSFRKIDDKHFEASANLTIRGVTVPVTLPFALTITPADSDKSASATIDGSVVLDRSQFKLGGSSWADASVIANQVAVDVRVTALLIKDK